MSKTLLIVLGGVALLAMTSSFLMVNKKEGLKSAEESILKEWKEYKHLYGKKFADPESEQYRMEVFAMNMKIVKTDETFGMTPFLDLTPEEFAETYLTLIPSAETKAEVEVKETEQVGSSYYDIDWVARGAVTGVKNQGGCGSCWAFSTTGAVEGARKVATGQLLSLSEQYLIDCSKDGNNGCGGGNMGVAFNYIQGHGIPSEDAYPYQGVDSWCRGAVGGAYWIRYHQDINSGDCNGVFWGLEQRPVAVAVDASNFQYYGGGIFNNCGNSLNHGVLLVGFNNGSNSWTVKNSWGAWWGEGGYIRIQGGNTCGICNMASFPTA